MNNKPDAALLQNRMIDRFGSVRQFALQTGIERTQIYPILRGNALPGLVNFVTMAFALGMELAELADALGVYPAKRGGLG